MPGRAAAAGAESQGTCSPLYVTSQCWCPPPGTFWPPSPTVVVYAAITLYAVFVLFIVFHKAQQPLIFHYEHMYMSHVGGHLVSVNY